MTRRVAARARVASATRLVQSPSALRTLANVLLATLVAVSIALAFVPWQQNVPGSGRVVAFEPFDRIQTLAAPVSGRVDRAWVVEGSRVEAGDPIIEIVDNDPSIVGRLKEQRDALTSQIEAGQEKVAVFRDHVEALESARAQAMDAARSRIQVAIAASKSAAHGVDASRAAARQAELNLERQRDLFSEGLASEFEFELAERARQEATARVEQALQALESARNSEAESRSELGKVDTEAQARIESVRAGLQAASVDVAASLERQALLDTRIAQQKTQRITAPRTGTILRLYAAPGAELVKAGDPLVTLIPDTENRAVELWVDGNNVPLIEPDRAVRLQFEGWPAVQFAGWPSVAIGTFGGRVALIDSSADAQGQFRLLVVPDEDDEPWPRPLYLRQGVRARGFVLLDRVSLGYEFWRLANDFPPTVAMRGDPSTRDPKPAEPAPRGKEPRS